MTNKKGITTGKVLAAGAGLAAIGASAYYLLGPKGKEHQKKAKALLAKIKQEVKRDAKKAKNMSVPLYHKIVNNVSKVYREQYKAHEKEIKDFAEQLKEDWKEAASKAVRESTQAAKKVASKVKGK